MECSPLWLPESVRFSHLQDELGYHLSQTKCVTFSFCVPPGGMVSGKKTASLVQFLRTFVWYCQFLICSGSRMKNSF